MTGIWAVLPVARTDQAKPHFAPVLSPATRQELLTAMFLDVLDALLRAPGLAGIAVLTEDPTIAHYARQSACRVITDGADTGHTGAVTAAARRLAAEGHTGMLTLPSDIPLVTPNEIATLLQAHQSFTIAPSHDDRRSNAIALTPPDALPLRFGDDSFHPQCAAATEAGLNPTILRLPGIACDIDTPEDIQRFMAIPSGTRARGVLITL